MSHDFIHGYVEKKILLIISRVIDRLEEYPKDVTNNNVSRNLCKHDQFPRAASTH